MISHLHPKKLPRVHQRHSLPTLGEQAHLCGLLVCKVEQGIERAWSSTLPSFSSFRGATSPSWFMVSVVSFIVLWVVLFLFVILLLFIFLFMIRFLFVILLMFVFCSCSCSRYGFSLHSYFCCSHSCLRLCPYLQISRITLFLFVVICCAWWNIKEQRALGRELCVFIIFF